MGFFSPNIVCNYLTCIEKYNPDGEAVIYGRERIRWRDLAKRAKTVATALTEMGVRPGESVAFMFHNSPRFIEINLGIQIAGAVPVPVNYRFTGREIAYQVRHSDSVVFLYESLWEDSVSDALKELGDQILAVCEGKPGNQGVMNYGAFLSQGRNADLRVPTAPCDAAAMIYTGGTTGLPKGVLLSYGAHTAMHASLFAHLITHVGAMDIRFEQLLAVATALPFPGIRQAIHLVRSRSVKKILRQPLTAKILSMVLHTIMTRPELARFTYKKNLKFMLPTMPFFHDASYQLLMLALAMGNITFVLVPGAHFKPENVLETVGLERPFFMANVPAGWKRLVTCPEASRYNLDSIKICATGAGLAGAGLKKSMLAVFRNALIFDMFGQTEMTPVTTFRVDADPETLKAGSVGRSIVDVRIVDDKGRDVPAGEPGEIVYRSETRMMGYYKDKEKTDGSMMDGWFRSGDLGYMDRDGEIRLIDRKNECINTGGEKVYPLEVEEVLHGHPAVDQVCVIGVPDEVWGSSVRAVVVKVKGCEVSVMELLDFCRGRLAGFKRPRSVVFADELPLSPVGKILRARVRERFGSESAGSHLPSMVNG